MRDIPVFTTEYGAASLTLRQIPYQKTAYVRIQASQQPDALIDECVGFCRACGAESVVATGHGHLEKYPFHTSILSMQCLREALPDTDACLWPVTEESLSNWQEIYNSKIKNIPNAAWMSDQDMKKMLSEGDGYFVHKDGRSIGIGRASGTLIRWVAAVEQGCGRDVVLALAHALFCETVTLEVASTNDKAMKLYMDIGFVPTAEISRWYKIY